MLHALGLPRALSDPVVDPGEVDAKPRLITPCDRIEESDLLQALAPLTLAAVGNDQMIKGLIPRPAPRQANSDHDLNALVLNCSRTTGQKSASSMQTQALTPVYCLSAPNILFRRPPFMLFIMRCISRNCFSSRLTSWTCTPDPAAIRRLREPSMMAGCLRSRG